MTHVQVQMEAHDNVSRCMLYGQKQPGTGREATEQALNYIRQWIRSAELLDTADGRIKDDVRKIVIDLIHGLPMEITLLAGDVVQLIDGGGAIRFLQQSDLHRFLEQL
jgi:hypothetical protein